MNKREFLVQLRKRLSPMPKNEINEHTTFYSEMIDDRMEEGMSEEEAVNGIGSVEDIAMQILGEISYNKHEEKVFDHKRKMSPWEWLMIILGSPIWLAILIAVIAIVLSAYIVMWSVVVALWAIEVSAIACSIGLTVSFAIFAVQGNVVIGIAMLGIGLFVAGTSILFYFLCKYVTKLIITITKSIFKSIITLFRGKEAIK